MGVGAIYYNTGSLSSTNIEISTVRINNYICTILSLQSAILPLPTVLNGLMMNGVLGQVYPQLQDQLLLLFETVDAPNCRVTATVHVQYMHVQYMYIHVLYRCTCTYCTRLYVHTVHVYMHVHTL